MPRALPVIRAYNIDLVLTRLIDEIRRLVHVIPDTCNAILRVGTMQIAPPAPRLRQSEIDKYAVTWPHPGYEQTAVGALLKEVSFQAIVEHIIALFLRLEFWSGYCAKKG